MGVAESLTRGRKVVDEPLTVLVGLVGLYLLFDLLAKLAGVEVGVMGVKLIGGHVAVSQFLTFVLDGLIIGLVIGLAGVGLSMTYSILNFANFSHGDLVTSGAFSGWAVTWAIAGIGTTSLGNLLLIGATSGASAGSLGISIATTPIAIVIGLIVSAVFAVLLALFLDRVVYKPMREEEGIALLIASVGVALALRYAIVFIWQPGTRGLTGGNQLVPSWHIYSDASGAVTLDAHELTLAVAAVVLMLGVHVLLQRTKLGKAMRAMADNKPLARVTGIPTERVVRATWVIGGGLAGVAGYLVALERGTISFNLGWILLLLIFAAVILGGIGSIYGAIAGGLVIGLTSTVALVWIPNDFALAAAFTVMIIMLLVKPEGLFSGVTTA
jgi:branched-chain amino acid transport system permease protein